MRGLIAHFFFFVPLFCLGIFLTGCSGDPSDPSTTFILSSQDSVDSQPTNGTIIVDTGEDVVNENPCTQAAGDCSLRDAIRTANGREGGNATITFAADYMFHLKSPLPTLFAPGTKIKAAPAQEIHIDGNNIESNVLRITGNNVEIMGLRIYGAGQNHTNIRITENARGVVIGKNLIGDDDRPAEHCGGSQSSYGGILINAAETIEADKTRAWIHGNIIECHQGDPGDGIIIFANGVIVGKDKQGTPDGNLVRNNRGWGINLNDSTGNTISNNEFVRNGKGDIAMNSSNFDNDWSNNSFE